MKTINTILLFAALSGVASLTNAAPSYSAEIGPEIPIVGPSVDRATIALELKAARAAGTLHITENNYPRQIRASSEIKRADVVREAVQTKLMRQESARTGANGYSPG
jgi:hypothetical protein